ncbi:hypothetical protein FRC07_000542 [Ceratobasidium sp. 392]|nr:hypothetical protein FRC07_000542 [Ceratobasidium sp. 392]
MTQRYETVPLQVPFPQVLKQEFHLRIEGEGIDRSPLQGRLGLEPCTWPVKATFTPTKDSIDIRWIELKAKVYERAYTTHIADIEEVSQVLWQSTAIVLGTEDNPSYESITTPRTLSHVFNVPSHLPSALQSKHKRAQVIWKLVFKIYRKSGAFKREFIEYESKFPAIKSYLPLPSIEHDIPLMIKGESPKKDVTWTLVITGSSELIEVQLTQIPQAFPHSLYAPGEIANGILTLAPNPRTSPKSQLRSIQLELTEYVVASGEPDVLLDTLYRQKIEASGADLGTGPRSFNFDVLVPRKARSAYVHLHLRAVADLTLMHAPDSPDYSGTFMSVTHRFQLTTAWKGRLLDKVTSHPIVLAALSQDLRQQALEEVAQSETTPSIAPPARGDERYTEPRTLTTDVPPPSYNSTQHLLTQSATTLGPNQDEDELSSIHYRSRFDTPTTSSVSSIVV